MNLIIFGDSIAQGCWDKEGGWPIRIRKEITKRQISGAKPFRDFNLVYNKSISGNTSSDLNNRIDIELNSLPLDSHTTIVIQTGFNDSIVEEGKNRIPPQEFKHNLNSIIEKSKEIANNIILVGFSPVDESKSDPLPDEPKSSYKNLEIKRYEELVEEISEENSIKFIPLYNKLNDNSWCDKLWDGVHPNTEGHKRIYEEVRNPIFEEIELDLNRE